MRIASRRESDAWPITLAIGIFALFSIWAAITSYGFLEADSCTHYLYSRFAFQDPSLLVNVWGRPICTALYAIPATLFGRLGVRFTSLLVAIGIGLVAYRIAKIQNYRWPALALIFTLAQPLVFLHSFTELTELPFALMLALGFWAYQKRQWLAMAILIGLTPLARPEGFGFVALAALALIVHRRWWWLAVLPIPLIAWNHAGWVLFGSEGPWWRWLRDNWPYSAQSLYTPGSIFHFVMLLPAVISPLMFPALCIGIWRALLPLPPGEGRGEGALNTQTSFQAQAPLTLFRTERELNQILIAAIPLLILVVHSVLYHFGKMASNGELRYMLVVAPFWALLAANGWEWIFTRMNWSAPLRAAGIAALVPALVNLFYWKVLPLRLGDDWNQARAIAAWYQHGELRKNYPFICAAHPALFYFLDMPMVNEKLGSLEWGPKNVDHPPAGTLLIWDSIYGVYNADIKRSINEARLQQAGWLIYELPHAEKESIWCIALSPRDISGHPTTADSQSALEKILPTSAR
ncbi:MAG TPA: hypothetical protein VGF52_07255 [Tepidisphaeraceae bacterium]